MHTIFVEVKKLQNKQIKREVFKHRELLLLKNAGG